MRHLIGSLVAAGSLVASAETYTVPAGTTEAVTSENAATYNAYESITVPNTAGLDFVGPGSTGFTPPVTVESGGSLVVSNGADVVLGTQQMSVYGAHLVTNAVLRRATLPGDVKALNESMILTGTMKVEAGAIVSNRFNIGYNWRSGIVIQNGGTVVNLGGTSATSDNMPRYGYGGGSYYELRGGTHEILGSVTFGGTSYGGSVFAMYDGEVKQTKRDGNAAYFRTSAAWGACGYYQFGGTARFQNFTQGAYSAPMAMYVGGAGTTFSSTFSALNANPMCNHTDVLTIGDGATWSGPIMLNAQSSKYDSRLVLTVNFNGATVKGVGDWSYLAHANLEAVPDTASLRNVINPGGLTLDCPDVSPIIIVPLRGTTGKGVKSVKWDKTKTYAYCPVIIIEETGGGSGYGAAAVPIYDPETKTVTDIKIVAPGSDYTEATAYLMIGSSSGGEQTGLELLETELADNANTGGLTVKSGNWHLRVACTYGGVTEVAGGAIYLEKSEECSGSLPTNTALRLTGGKMSLGGTYANEQTFRSIGGTAGTFTSATKAYDVAYLDIDTAQTLDLSAFTLTVTGRWDIAAADLAAGKCADYNSKIVFGETATLDVMPFVEAGVSDSYELVKAANGLTGMPTLVGTEAANFKLFLQNNVLTIRRRQGLEVIVR